MKLCDSNSEENLLLTDHRKIYTMQFEGKKVEKFIRPQRKNTTGTLYLSAAQSQSYHLGLGFIRVLKLRDTISSKSALLLADSFGLIEESPGVAAHTPSLIEDTQPFSLVIVKKEKKLYSRFLTVQTIDYLYKQE
ncbi:unnamed protein product [Allacma fusca]|uniref:Uncharacterized protein n=1 Tax=Allacma fusca TaxID=39272 RepID=A0A8J2KPK2_9HEXA|nr:unnamed protein product [Allacma fusca]